MPRYKGGEMFKTLIISTIALAMIVGTSALSFADDADKARIAELERKVEELTDLVHQFMDDRPLTNTTAAMKAPEGIEDRVAVLEDKVKKGSKWLEKLKLKGDFRFRHEQKFKPQGEDINRQRIRLRYGLTAEVNDKTEVGFGLATGSSDAPVSTFQTLEKEFQSKAIWLDYAYGKYKHNKNLTFLVGKFKSPFLHTDMLWDADIRFDGVALQGNIDVPENILANTNLYATIGYFPIDDSAAGESDFFMIGNAVGLKSKITDRVSLNTAVNFWDFRNLEGRLTSTFAESKSTNSSSGGVVSSGFRIVNPIVKLTFKELLGNDVIPPLTVFYEYAKNVDDAAMSDDSAWRTGIDLKKGKRKKGDWRLIGQYSRIETDAFPDAFPDAAFNSGGTNAKGWEGIIEYYMMNNMSIDLDYYNTKAVTGSELNEEVVQVNLTYYF